MFAIDGAAVSCSHSMCFTGNALSFISLTCFFFCHKVSGILIVHVLGNLEGKILCGWLAGYRSNRIVSEVVSNYLFEFGGVSGGNFE